MTPEDLLKPRYKVIADYPGNLFNVGFIHDKNDVLGFMLANFSPVDFSKYPAIFKRLEWWEERKEDEMPEYIKCNGVIWRVDNWDMEMIYPTIVKNVAGDKVSWFWKHEDYLPATKEEYENQ